MDGTVPVPGRAWYWIAGLLALAGPVAAVALAIGLVGALGGDTRFLGPGSVQLELKRPGKHIVWFDYATSYEGRIYSGSQTLPEGARVRVTDLATGRTLALGAAGAMTSREGATARVAIASFEAEAPGNFQVTVEGRFEPRVFSAGPDMLPRMLWTIFGGVMLVLGSLGAAAALAVWAYLGRNPPVSNRPVVMAQAAAAGEAQAPAARDPEYATRQLVALVYALQAVAFFAGITLIAGVIVNYVKRDEVAGSWFESHFTWQIRTFWWCLAWSVLGAALAVVLVGIPILVANAIWLLYRIIKGWIRLSEGKPMYA